MSRQRGITLIEVVAIVILLIVALAIVAFSMTMSPRTGRRPTGQMWSNTQLRGIQQGMVNYAYGNNSFYPGIDGTTGDILSDGPTTTGNSGGGETPAARYWVLLNGNYFTGDYAISPLETNAIKSPWTQGPVTTQHFSYALLQLGPAGSTRDIGRRAEWKDTINTSAPVASDRNLGADTAKGARSIHPAVGGWQGSVAKNDNSTFFSTTHILKKTKYSQGPENPTDNLFIADENGRSGGDAAMVYGNADDLVNQ